MFGVGTVIGLVAGMVGTGGAFLAVPFMTRCNVKVHTAVGDVGRDRLAGRGSVDDRLRVRRMACRPTCRRYAVGYVYLPALAGIVVMSMLLAPLGARVAHAWPVARLRRAFAVMLWVLGAWMWWKALSH